MNITLNDRDEAVDKLKLLHIYIKVAKSGLKCTVHVKVFIV